MATRLQDAAGFPVGRNLVRKEHGAELAGDDIELSIRKRQRQRVGLSPGDAIIGQLRRGVIEHRLVEVGRHDANLRGKPRGECPGDDAGARGRLQQILWINAGDPLGQIARVGLENEGNEEAVVDFRDRSRE